MQTTKEEVEVRKVPFVGFYKEKMHLEIVEDSNGKRDHIWVISSGGERLLYLHIDELGIHSYRTKGGKDFSAHFNGDED